MRPLSIRPASPTHGAVRHAGFPLLIALAALAGFLFTAAAARAQERQIPFDRSGRVERVDAKLAERIGLFANRYPGFQEARLFMAADSSMILEVTSVQNGSLQRERIPLTAAGADSLRSQVSALIAVRAPSAALNQEGRVWLLCSTTLLGLGFYGWALPVAADLDNSQSFSGVYLLISGGSFFLPYVATLHHPVSYGMTNLSLYGASRGIVHGILIYHALIEDPDRDYKGALLASWITSLTEGIAGYAWARHANLGAGSATAIADLGDMGLLNALGAVNLNDGWENDHSQDAAGWMLAGSAAGMIGGGVLAAHRRYSYGDAIVMRDATLLGVLVAESITDWADTRDSKPFIAAAMVGSGVGFIAGDVLVRDTDFSPGASTLVTLGTIAGGAAGLGAALVATSNSDDKGPYLLTAGALGAVGGFTLTYRAFRDEARRKQTDRSSWRFEVSPAAAAMAVMDRGGRSMPAAPIVRVTRGF